MEELKTYKLINSDTRKDNKADENEILKKHITEDLKDKEEVEVSLPKRTKRII